MRYQKLSNRDACRFMLKKWRALDRHLKAERARGMNHPEPPEANPWDPLDRSNLPFDRLFSQNDVSLPVYGPLKLTWLGLTDRDVDLFDDPRDASSRGDFHGVEAKTDGLRAKPADYRRLKIDDFDLTNSDPFLIDDADGMIHLIDDIPNDFIDELEAFDETLCLEDEASESFDLHQPERDSIARKRRSA